jgi:hypothetical protein
MHDFDANYLLLSDAPRLVRPMLWVFDSFLISHSAYLDYTSPFDATVVDVLKKSGARIIGKTNCDEFGMGYVCQTFRKPAMLIK